MFEAKKLASIARISISVIANLGALAQKITSLGTLANNFPKHSLCICYAIRFAKAYIKTLINFGSEVNVMMPGLATSLSLITQRISMGVQTIDNSSLKMYNMVLAEFFLQNSLVKIQFFKKYLC